MDRTKGNGHRTTIEKLDLQDLVLTPVFRHMDCQIDVTSICDDGVIDMAALNDLYEGFTSLDEMPYVLHDGWPYPVYADGGYAPGIVSMERDPNDESLDPVAVATGYGYTSRSVMLWQELPSNSQTSLGMKRRATSIVLQVYRSGNPFGGYWTPLRERLERLPRLVKAYAEQTQRPELFTGLVRIPVPSNTDEMVHAVVQADEPLPMTILAIETKYTIQEV